MTLLEVIISLSILAIMMTNVQQMISQTYRLSDSLLEESDFYTSIRVATRLLDRDLSMLFSPTFIYKQPPTTIFQGLESVGAYWGGAINQSGLRPARFVGDDTSIRFVSASHVPMYRERRESTFAKIQYTLEKESNPDYPKEGRVLVKTQDTQAFTLDENAKRGGVHRYELMHGIKSWKWTYWVRNGLTWTSYPSWDTEMPDLRNRYPDLLQVEFEVRSQRRLTFSAKYKYAPMVRMFQ